MDPLTVCEAPGDVRGKLAAQPDDVPAPCIVAGW
jgi:hypothetical protein